MESGSVRTIIVNLTFVFLATVAVVLRFFARRIRRTEFFIEDYMILIALVSEWTLSLYFTICGGVFLPHLSVMYHLRFCLSAMRKHRQL